MQIQEALSRYGTQLLADGRSPHTAQQYRRHLRVLELWMEAELGTSDIGVLKHEHLAQLLASPLATLRKDGKPKRPNSVNALRSSLRAFFGYCEAAGYVERNPARLVRRAVCGAAPPRVLKSREKDRLLELLDAAQTDAQHRDRVLFRLMLATGIRISSALALDVEDVDLEEGELRLRFVKRGREQVVLLGMNARSLLAGHIGGRASGPLFLNALGERVGQRNVQRRFRLLADRVRARGATVHSLRHTFATELYRVTSDLIGTSVALGHRSITSTMIYASAPRARHGLEAGPDAVKGV